MGDQTSSGITQLIENLVRDELQAASVDTWVERILRSIVGAVPEVRSDTVLTEAVRDATVAHWRSFLTDLGQREQEFRLVPRAAEVVTTIAQRGHPLHVILGIYAAAQREVWRYIIDVTDQLPAAEFDKKEVLVHFWTRASAWFDNSVEASLRIFNDELDRIRQGDAARRLDAVRAILNEEVTNVGDAAASLGGHPLSGFNTAMVLHTYDDNVIADLHKAATTLAAHLELPRVLVTQPGGRELWCWVSSRAEPAIERLHKTEEWLADHKITAAVGAPAAGLNGFRSTHRDAVAAQRLAMQSHSVAQLTLFTEVELLTLLAESDGTPAFVSRALGALAEGGESNERLRETVHALLINGSIEAAAKALSVHKNTVRYRVDRAEELLGRPVSAAPTETELALRWHARFAGPPS